MKSKISNKNLEELFTLGNLFISDFVNIQPDDSYKSELKLMYCPESQLVQLENSVNPDKMYGKYWYRSGTNNTMKRQLHEIVNDCLQLKPNVENGLWLDIACNDGTLLSFVPSNNFKRLGIDPADDSYKKESEKIADEIIQDYFSISSYNKSKFKNQKCDIITCIAMFYDLDNPIPFLNDIKTILKDDGLLVLQMSYTPLMVQQLAFDNICHEHLMYYSLNTLKYVLSKVDMKIVDCQLNDVNGGSFRIYIQKNSAPKNSFGTAPYRDVANFRVNSILEYETTIGANTKKFYMDFYEKIKELKNKTYNFIVEEKKKGKSIWVYGASTKGNTLLQYFGLNSSLIDKAVERSPYKFGLKTIGTDIPIVSEKYMRENMPDYLLILPWHFVDEFIKRETEFLKNGGKFIIPCPKFEILTKN